MELLHHELKRLASRLFMISQNQLYVTYADGEYQQTQICFCKVQHTFPQPTRCEVGLFPSISCRPFILIIDRLKFHLPSKPILRGNLRKANWSPFAKFLEKSVKYIPAPCLKNVDNRYPTLHKLRCKAFNIVVKQVNTACLAGTSRAKTY